MKIGVFKPDTHTAFQLFYKGDLNVHFPLQNIQKTLATKINKQNIIVVELITISLDKKTFIKENKNLWIMQINGQISCKWQNAWLGVTVSKFNRPLRSDRI